MALRPCKKTPIRLFVGHLFVDVAKTKVDDVVRSKYLFDEFCNCSLRIVPMRNSYGFPVSLTFVMLTRSFS